VYSSSSVASEPLYPHAEGTFELGNPGDDTAALLGESFELVKRGLPSAYHSLAASMAGLRVRISVSSKAFEVGVENAALFVSTATSASSTALIETDAGTILNVLDAQVTLHTAVTTGALRVTAALEHLAVLHEALLTYTHAAVRCAGFAEVLVRFRALHCSGDHST
jgi:hypothetical protein